ncbi:hypothetical protein V6R98_27100 [Agrobacterium sp. CCNWLW71]|uniref:hypothetical protein n=1 Tax=unclassified Agrobacterium TaxID=2632611 RepID=UPI002FF398A0
MIFAKFDDMGFPVGFWIPEACSNPEEVIPADAIVITEAQHLEFLENAGGRKFIDGEVVIFEPPFVPPVTVVFAVDLWSRMTNAEADQVGAAMAEQPFRVRKIFETANTYRADHELWPLLVQIATTLFGEERAAQILAPSSQQ